MFANFRQDAEFKCLFKCFISLAFVPVTNLYEYFCILSYQFPRTDEFEAFLTYFTKNWMGCRRIMQSPTVTLDDPEFGPYGQVDVFLRQWIEFHHFENNGATFSPEFWNVCYRVENDLARTNNGLESWHNVFNQNFSNGHPKLSVFVNAMEKEDAHWELAVEDFIASPVNGIRGKGSKRKAENVEQDQNLIEISRTREKMGPLEYLKSISYRMPNPV